MRRTTYLFLLVLAVIFAVPSVADDETNHSAGVAPYHSWVSEPFLSTPPPASSPVPAYQRPTPAYQPPPAPATFQPPVVSDPAFNQQLTFQSPSSLHLQPPAANIADMILAVGFDESNDLDSHLLVVFNTNDPDSADLAHYYASRRNIAPDHVLGISCPTNEEISRAQFQSTLWQPIDTYLTGKKWLTRRSQQVQIGKRMWNLQVADHNEIWAIVLMRGVPLKIASDPTDTSTIQSEPLLATNAAAVDSELALLPISGLPRGGYVQNPLFDMTGGPAPLHVGSEAARHLILVTRLDGPQPQDVRRMIDDSLYAEKNRLAGLAVIDSRGKTDLKDGYTLGDSWLRHARVLLTLIGWQVKFDDKEELIPATDPLNHVALYFGWYAGTAVGPWITSPDRFVRGAIAYHLHSFSASTVRSTTDNWVGPLIAHGAAATMGTVYEPYLDLTPHLDIFTRHLLAGQPFAVAAYSSLRGLSWMDTVVGDPLYRPFRVPLADALAAARAAGPDLAQHADWLLLQQMRSDLEMGKISGQVADLQQQIDLNAESGVGQEGLADLLEKSNDPAAGPAMEKAYQRALNLDFEPIDQIRVGLKLAQYYTSHSEDELAQNELRQLRELHPAEADRFGVANPLIPTGGTGTVAPTPSPEGQPVLPQVPQPPGPPHP